MDKWGILKTFELIQLRKLLKDAKQAEQVAFEDLWIALIQIREIEAELNRRMEELAKE